MPNESDVSSHLSLVFETDFRNPDKSLDVYDGGIYVMGKMKDSGNLVIRDKPDERMRMFFGVINLMQKL